jgi:lysophospholipase L1-like esterase
MHERLTLFLRGAAFLFVASAFATLARAEQGGVSVLSLGDSITRGYGSSDDGGYREPLYQMLVSDGRSPRMFGTLVAGDFPQPRHEGHDGATLRQLASIYGQLSNHPEQTILLMAGTNDIWNGTGPDSPANAPANLDRLIDTIFRTSPDVQLFVSSIPPIYNAHINQEVQAVVDYNAQIPGLVAAWSARGRSIHFVDAYGAMDITDLFDGVHPNDAGYQAIAGAFHTAIEAAVPEPSSIGAIMVLGSAGLLRRRRHRHIHA